MPTSSPNRLSWILLLLLVSVTQVDSQALLASDFEEIIKPALAKNCQKCHNNTDSNSDINFESLTTENDFVSKPELIARTLEVLEAGEMPPETEPTLADTEKSQLVTALRKELHLAIQSAPKKKSPIHRLNRFQYNNTVRDLFELNRDIFELPEKLMTRKENYLLRLQETQDPQATKMPDVVQVASHALNPLPGIQEVSPFPKDLRAEHGFDNQASQLTLSPLLLDSFLRLSVSIIESPDFNEANVGIWNRFFREPESGYDRDKQVRSRLAWFLRKAFRQPVDADILDRYTQYTIKKLESGSSFTDAMKKVAAAVLSSPYFLYKTSGEDEQHQQFELATRLSYLLWGSCPDDGLLDLAERGELANAETLRKTVARMQLDPKIERFLDAFPTQWMQLENLMAATPDPAIAKYFRLDPEHPASLQMVLEPLLLFDSAYVENRPLVELVSPNFGYRSDFLQTWYTSDLTPEPVDIAQIASQNQANDKRRHELTQAIESTAAEIEILAKPAREKLRSENSASPPETQTELIQPYAAWDFEGNLNESIRGLDLTAHGDVGFENGAVVLKQSFLQSKPLETKLRQKSLEVWFRLENPDQPGGGLMTVQGPGDYFDSIVIGERKPRHWISGSNGFARTDDFGDSFEEIERKEVLHLVMTYEENGVVTLYRNGAPYGKPFQKELAAFPKGLTSILFGLRHLPAGGNRNLNVVIEGARLYERALTADEAKRVAELHANFFSEESIVSAVPEAEQAKYATLRTRLSELKMELKSIPANIDPAAAIQDSQRRFEDRLRRELKSTTFRRVDNIDARFGGIITNAAMLSMTSGPNRTHPVARGVWIIEVIFNNPPPPPPNDVPPLDEDNTEKDLTIREKFAAHRANPSCAGCHAKIDPLGFALENFDIAGRWRDKYSNGREVDSSGSMFRQKDFKSVVEFKAAIVDEEKRFAKAFVEHLLRYALSRELEAADQLTIELILEKTESNRYPLRDLIREVAMNCAL